MEQEAIRLEASSQMRCQTTGKEFLSALFVKKSIPTLYKVHPLFCFFSSSVLLLLVAMPGAPSSVLVTTNVALVSSSVLVTTSKALVTRSDALVPSSDARNARSDALVHIRSEGDFTGESDPISSSSYWQIEPSDTHGHYAQCPAVLAFVAWSTPFFI